MAIRPLVVDEETPFLGEACALCKEPFAPDDGLVICPEDATRHHVHCWQANGNRCTAYGCLGRGEVRDIPEARVITARHRGTEDYVAESKVQTLPARGFHCAQSCLLLAIAIAIIIFAIGCFGLWALADYIAVEILNWEYRPPVAGMAPWLGDLAALITLSVRWAASGLLAFS
jgi:hypothetical protein